MFQQLSTRMSGLALTGALVSVFALAAAAGPLSSQERKATNQAKTSGVIVKVEPAEQGDQGRKRTWRVTINTDVVWRDFVRDQAKDPAKAARTGTAKAAAQGKNSVAAEGHPRDAGMLTTVNLDPRTEITMRYRSSTDEITEGAPTPEGASRAEDAVDSSSPIKNAQQPSGAGTRRQALKARVLEPMELKPGLWIDVEFRGDEKDKEKENRARRVMVMRPVGGPDTPPDKEKGPTTRKARPGL